MLRVEKVNRKWRSTNLTDAEMADKWFYAKDVIKSLNVPYRVSYDRGLYKVELYSSLQDFDAIESVLRS